MKEKICKYIFAIFNIIAATLYFIAFFTKNMIFLGFGGAILIINSIAGLICDNLKKKKKVSI